jgi:hypothetical protein
MKYAYVMRKFLSFGLVLAFSFVSAAVPANSAVKLGDACKSLGQTATLNGSTVSCIKSGSKLVWSKGVKVNSYDVAFAKSHLLEAQAKAAKILADAKSFAEQISSAPNCKTSNSSARASIGSDGNLRALIFENPGICDITVRASASFRCDSPLPPSKNTVRSTGVFPLRAKEKLTLSNWSYYFPQVNLECRLLTGSSGLAINLSRDGQSPSVMTLTSSYSGSFNQAEASKKAENLLKTARTQADKIVSDAKNPALIAKVWKAAADKVAEKLAAEKLAADTLAVTCVVGSSCKVGNTGPGGGEVFYDAGIEQPWGRFLEFAPNGWYGSASDPSVKWCDNDSWPVYGPEGTSIGQGKPNTKLMLQNCTSGAAVAAASYRGGSKDDWYLPSKDELNELAKYVSRDDENDLVANGGYGRLKIIREGFKSALWSSTDYREKWGYAYAALGHGQLSSIWSKYYQEYVRPVRAFSIADATTVRKAATNKNCSPNPICSVGSTGPGGGEVFYDAGSQQSWGRYLEFAPKGWSGKSTDPQLIWCDLDKTLVGDIVSYEMITTARVSQIGKGKSNTDIIVSKCSTGAGVEARRYTGGGKLDWSLPSIDELNELCKYAGEQAGNQAKGDFKVDCRGTGENQRGGFTENNYYWSSSERNEQNTWQQALYGGGGSSSWKSALNGVRPVRAF